MSDSAAFTAVCEQLEQQTSLDRLEARGTVRLALKQAGLEAHGVSGDQMAVVVEKVLPKELEARGISETASFCTNLATAVRDLAGDEAQTPEAVFARLGGNR